MDEKGLGKRLQDARRASGLTQQSLCQKSGLSYSTLAKIERGAIKAPSIFTIERIANALNISLDELIGSSSSNKLTKTRQRSRSGIEFVYFDINGCLVRFYHQAFTKIARDTSKITEAVESVFWHYNDQVCRGKISLEEFNKILRTKLEYKDLNWEDYYLSTIEAMPGMSSLLEWINSRYGVGLLSNIMPGLINSMVKMEVIPDIKFDAIIDSSKVGAIKPEKKIFELASKMADCDPTSILLIDDSRTNLMAADMLGWKVMWFDGYQPEDSISRIKEMLEPAD